jgi:hypothetical protein
MLQTQNECPSDYYNIYTLHFFKTLGQLSAGLLSTAVLVPMYTYYSRYAYSYEKVQVQNEVSCDCTGFCQENCECDENCKCDCDYEEDEDEEEGDLQVERNDTNENVEDIEDVEDLDIESEEKQNLGYTNINSAHF